MVLHRNRVHFLGPFGLLARSRSNEGAGSAQREAEQNNRNFHGQRHESVQVLSRTFTAKLLPIGANK